MGPGEPARPDAAAFGCLIAFAAVTYAAPAEWIPAAGLLRPALATSGLALALMVVGKLARREGLTMDGARGWAFAAFAGLAAASTRWSIDPPSSVGLAVELAKSVAIYVTLVNLVTSSRRLALLCGALVVGSMVTSVGVLDYVASGRPLVEGFRARWVGLYADPNRMAMSLGIVVPLGAALAIRRGTRKWARVAGVAAAGLAAWAMVLSHSRGGLAGLAVALGVWTLLERRAAQTLLVAALAAAVVALAPASFWDRAGTVARFQEDASAMGRVHAWTVAARASSENPLVGIGAGGFQTAWVRYAPPESHRAYAAHNFFLQVVGELGLVGLLLFLVFVSGGVAGAFAASSDEEVGPWARALAAALSGYLVSSLFAGFLASQHFYVLVGLAAAAHRLSLGRTSDTCAHILVKALDGGGAR